MNDRLNERLNAMLPRVTSEEFLSGSGLGNELAFYVFDYPPEHELRVREHVAFLLDQIPKKRPNMRVNHINMFDLVIDHLKARNFLDKLTAMQLKEGDVKVLNRLEPILHPQKLVPVFVEAAKPKESDLVLVTGIGSVWPVLRSHTLLNNLHAHMGTTPLVMFYPGKYDQTSLRLFNRVESHPYYRAFKLMP